MSFKQARISDRALLVLELNMITPRIAELRRKADLIKEKIQDIDLRNKSKGMSISTHAVQRFRERIGNWKDSIITIKELILTDNFLKRFGQLGEGRISHPDIEHCDIVIMNNTIITVINTNMYNPYRELDKLEEYMKYYINHIAENKQVLSFKDYKSREIERYKQRKNTKNEISRDSN